LYNQTENINSILVIRLTSIGDVLLTTPMLRILRTKFPKAKIDMLTTTQMIDVFKYNPNIDNLFTVPRDAGLKELRYKKADFFSGLYYDTVIDLQNNVKSKVLRKKLSNAILTFDKRRLYKLKLVYLKHKPGDFQLIPDLYIQTAAHLGIKPDGKGLEFWLPVDKINNSYLSQKSKARHRSIVIAPGAFHFTKRLPAEKFSDLIDLLLKDNCDISLIGGKEDIEIAAGFVSVFGEKIKNFTGELTLAGSAEIIDKADCVITNDTAIMHIAAARQTPVVALFGSTVKELGFIPYHSPYRIIEKELDCRPCTHFGKAKCPKSHFNCMNLITADEIYRAVMELIG